MSHGYPRSSMVARYPFDHICIDLKEMPTSDSGNNYYLLVIDVATRFVLLRALEDKAAYTVAQTLFQICTDICFPKIIQSDNGSEFLNEVMTSTKALANVMERLIAPYSHKSNGMAERASGAYRLQGIDGTEYVRFLGLLNMVVPQIVNNLNLKDTLYAAVSKIVSHKDLEDGTYDLLHPQLSLFLSSQSITIRHLLKQTRRSSLERLPVVP